MERSRDAWRQTGESKDEECDERYSQTVPSQASGLVSLGRPVTTASSKRQDKPRRPRRDKKS